MSRNSAITLRELLNSPDVNKYLQSGEMDNIVECCLNSENQTEPLYVKIFLGIAAWIAAAFIIGAISSLIGSNDSALSGWGACFLIFAIFLERSVRLVVFRQFALAIAISGNIMLVIGCTELFELSSPLGAFIVQVLICGVTYPLYKNGFYRVASTSVAGILCAMAIMDLKLYHAQPVLIGCETLLVGYLYLKKRRPAFLNPLAVSSVIMLPISLLIITMSLNRDFYWGGEHFSLLPSGLVLATGIIVLCFYLAGGFQLKQLKKEWLVTVVVLTVILGFISSPGILAALGLLALGYYRRDNFPMAMAIFSLVVFLILYYYQMKIDLAYKSAVIGGSGIVLLIACWLLNRIQRREVKKRAESEVRA